MTTTDLWRQQRGRLLLDDLKDKLVELLGPLGCLQAPGDVGVEPLELLVRVVPAAAAPAEDVDGDPLENISELRDIDFVMKNGTVYLDE